MYNLIWCLISVHNIKVLKSLSHRCSVCYNVIGGGVRIAEPLNFRERDSWNFFLIPLRSTRLKVKGDQSEERNETTTASLKKRRIQGDDSAGIREARFAFPHYCHVSNYAPTKAVVRRVDARGRKEREELEGLLSLRHWLGVSRVARFAANGRNQS